MWSTVGSGRRTHEAPGSIATGWPATTMSNDERDCTIRLGISTCLLGEEVRYDGGHKLDRFLVDTLGQYVEWVPVCPEVEMGLPVPRESMRLVDDPENPVW
ncbi:MAG: 2-thiouracil desulfurase family protein [Planctomycetota bacterium]